ncbi:nitrogen regulation protein NR(II) [Pseudoteredinibacter isoporae]|nr:nitrogen regulation protein NR(II) [Pseudoteredinibacter isoporae]NHO85438.1 nitrogen regulation protein NR(II) [Pseudoteredinibacter isoporae]NIB26110.1 nitrogen regulation protein NR(II) [Pseudoteredinibacter isoporae]
MEPMNYQQLLDSLNTAVVIVDPQLQLLHMNPAAENLLAVSRAQVANQSFLAFFRESDEAITTLQEALQKQNQYTKRRACWLLPNGNQLTIDYSVTPLADQDGLAIEIQPLDRLLRISREEALLSAQETSRNLARNMAHEIKNPLGGIRGAAQLLSKELDSESLKDYTQVIIDEADRLRNLVDRMLGPNQPLQLTAINIHEVLERILTVIHAEVGNKVELLKDYDPSIPDLPADPEQLIQALLNVARNAVQALLEANIETPQITLRSRVQRQFTIGQSFHRLVVRVDIIDNGPGIPDDILSHIFYPMITGRANGTGLGLAISQQLISQHGGLIECESEPGNTQFSIYLPLGKACEP